MKAYKIAVIAGDGIGPEVTKAAVAVLKKVGELEGFGFEFTSCDAGGCSIDKYGIPLTIVDSANVDMRAIVQEIFKK